MSTSTQAPSAVQQLQARIKEFEKQVQQLAAAAPIPKPADRILAVATFLTGDALDWFEPVMRNYLENSKADQEKNTKTLFFNYVNFEEKLKANFENPDKERTAAQQILRL
ncbi:hypothetical protein DL766_005424 [Monosporascus sp. MC13-8B]|nr:hypothetical protein DL766_005424 [Monosporascus sp. MC13-8B]